MLELVEANWPLLIAALLIGIVVAWWIFVAGRRTKVSGDRRDVLDEGANPAARNQALIDTPPAATGAPVNAPGLAGAGTAVAAAVEQQGAKAVKEEHAQAEIAPEAEASDDLTRIKGVGPKLHDMLITLGVTRLSQIAAWSDADIDRVDPQLGRFQGRIRRDNWVEQARLLNEGDMQGYQDKFGKI